MSKRIDNEKATILEAIKLAFEEFDEYEDVREAAIDAETDFTLSISVKIPNGFRKVLTKVSGAIKKTAEANICFDDSGQMMLDFDTEQIAADIERRSR